MRLNWYLPSHRKAKAEGARGRGPIRRSLEKLGPTWAFSPVRRLLQAGCLVAFLGLFLYVCWPYTARPARVWSGWQPAEVDAESGRVVVASEQPPAEPVTVNMVLYVVDQAAGADRGGIAFRVSQVGQQELTMEPAAPLAPQQLDRLATSFGPWSLYEADPAGWPSHYADELQSKQFVPAEAFLMLDPLMSISTAIAVKSQLWSGNLAETMLWWSLGCAGVLLLVCTVVPRGFCGYLCPLGTLLDLFDWALGRWVRRLRVGSDGWWVHLKYYLLAATLIAALLGVLLCGFLAAIPVVTRGMAFLLAPLQMGWGRGWHQVAPIRLGNLVSIALFLIVPALGLLRPRFWCKYVCPTGAVFSVANHLRLTQRKVQSNCIGCKRCVEVCPFDAIKPDFTTRVTDCTFCQTCGGACPVRAIQFVGRWQGAGGSGQWAVGSREL
jgi:NAD-dependent dihydropyrimidine dehydrogenase PreA subunit